MMVEEKTQRPLKVCFVVPYAYSLFNTETNFPFGGSEVRAWLFGTGLAKDQALDVSFMVFNHMQDKCERFQNITLWRDIVISPSKSFVRSVNWWTARGLTRRILNIFRRSLRKPAAVIPPEYKIYNPEYDVYRKLNTDVYCVFGVHSLAAKVAAFCKAHDKRFVLFTASDEDFSDLYYPGSIEVNPYGNVGFLANYAIENADTIICQSEQQAGLCRERFGREAFVVRNPAAKGETPVDFRFGARGNYVLWVGKSDRTKQPDIMLELAKRCPDIPFVMVMSPSISSFHEKIMRDQLPNTEIIEYQPYERMETLYTNAKAFVSTSKFEGFPNTFLDAGRHGVPIASLSVDPDKFIETHECGVSAGGSFEQLEDGIKHLLASQDRWEACARNVYDYVREFHDPEDKIADIKKLLFSG